MWNAVPAGIVCQHERIESLLRELARNLSLMDACGFDPDADWGHHETQGVDARTGKAWKKLKRWFGYGLPDPLPDGSDRRLCRRLHADERRIAGSPGKMRVQPGLHRRVHPVRRIKRRWTPCSGCSKCRAADGTPFSSARTGPRMHWRGCAKFRLNRRCAASEPLPAATCVGCYCTNP